MLLSVIDHLHDESDIAFVERIYAEYMPVLMRRANKYVSDLSLCEDLAHDCILNIIKYLDSLKKVPEDKLRVYLVVCIENVVKDYLIKDSKEKTCKGIDLGDSYNLIDEFDVDEELDKKSDYQTIRTSFDKLRERDKHIIMMKYDLGLKDEIIADTLSIEKNSVRVIVGRSIKRLQKMVRKEEAQNERV